MLSKSYSKKSVCIVLTQQSKSTKTVSSYLYIMNTSAFVCAKLIHDALCTHISWTYTKEEWHRGLLSQQTRLYILSNHIPQHIAGATNGIKELGRIPHPIMWPLHVLHLTMDLIQQKIIREPLAWCEPNAKSQLLYSKGFHICNHSHTVGHIGNQCYYGLWSTKGKD